MARPVSPLTKFIRSLPRDMPASEVIENANAEGMEATVEKVSRARRTAGARPAKKATQRAEKPSKAAAEITARMVTPKRTASPVQLSRSDFIRQQPSAMSAKEIVAKGEAQGLMFSDALVYMVRRRGGGKAKAKRPGISKADYIRQFPNLPANAVAAKAKAEGLNIAPVLVYKVRGYDRQAAKKRAAAKRAAVTPPANSAAGPVTKPRAVPSGARSTATGDAHIENLLRAAASALGFARALEVIQAEQTRLRAILGA